MTAYSDTFAADHLPPRDLWPVFDLSGMPATPARLNCGVELLDAMVERGFGDRPALWFGDALWTYADLKTRSDRVARHLVEALDLEPGNRVLLRGPNNPMMVAAWFGVLKAGGIVVATMPLLRAKELSYCVEKARIRHALCDSRLLDDLRATAERRPELDRIATFTPLADGEADLDRAADGPFTPVATEGEDIALIAFTSGTTGPAKGTMHAHRDVIAAADAFPKSIVGLRPDDVICGSPPLAFTFGLGALVLFPMRVGASTVLVERFAPTTMMETIARHKVTGIYTAPTAYRAMAAQARDYDISSLRFAVSAGEHLPKATWEAWHAATNVKIIDGIGSTEMLHIFISAAMDEIVPGSTGKAIPGYSARILDDAGNPVPDGTPGRLAVRGPTGCRYLDNEERQRAYVQSGWNVTGDVYWRDERGYFWYVARADDMIISAGYNISGPEVENCLLAHPKVAECAVIGAPDAERGTIVKAFVVRRDAALDDDEAALRKELQDFVKAEIAPYKYPRAITFLDALPRTETGKLQRFRLREHDRA